MNDRFLIEDFTRSKLSTNAIKTIITLIIKEYKNDQRRTTYENGI